MMYFFTFNSVICLVSALQLYFTLASIGLNSNALLHVNVTEYVLFSSDLIVYYNLETVNSTSGTDYAIQITNSSQLLLSAGLRRDVSQGHVVFRCDEIVSTGVHTIQLVDNNNSMAALSQVNITVVWPTVTLSVSKSQFTVLQDDIPVTITTQPTSAYCMNFSHFTVELCRLQHNKQTRCSFRQPLRSSQNNVIIACHHVDYPGTYIVRVVTSSAALELANSDVFELFANRQQYDIEPVWLDSIANCAEPIKVQFKRPSNHCTDRRQTNDRIRLYRQLASPGSAASAFLNNLEYIGEQRVVTTYDHVVFDCELFESNNNHDHQSRGYCFKYVTLSSNGAVSQQTMRCTFTSSQQALPVKGGWSAWSSWTACSQTCLHGVQVRYRTCDNPMPRNGGLYCYDGNAVETRDCYVNCSAARTREKELQPAYDPGCINITCEMSINCQCTVRIIHYLNVSSSLLRSKNTLSSIVISSGNLTETADCPLNTRHWFLLSDNGTINGAASISIVQMTLMLAHIHSTDVETVLQVRDGPSVTSNLLWSSRYYQQENSDQYSVNITITQPTVLISFTASGDSQAEFTAKIYVIQSVDSSASSFNDTIAIGNGTNFHDVTYSTSLSAVEISVVLIAGVVCIVIITLLTVVTMVCFSTGACGTCRCCPSNKKVAINNDKYLHNESRPVYTVNNTEAGYPAYIVNSSTSSSDSDNNQRFLAVDDSGRRHRRRRHRRQPQVHYNVNMSTAGPSGEQQTSRNSRRSGQTTTRSRRSPNQRHRKQTLSPTTTVKHSRRPRQKNNPSQQHRTQVVVRHRDLSDSLSPSLFHHTSVGTPPPISHQKQRLRSVPSSPLVQQRDQQTALDVSVSPRTVIQSTAPYQLQHIYNTTTPEYVYPLQQQSVMTPHSIQRAQCRENKLDPSVVL